MKKEIIALLFFVMISPFGFAQVTPQTQLYRNEPVGNRDERRTGTMEGNLVKTLFRNDGQVGYWTQSGYPGASGEWPKGTQHNYTDGCTPVISTRVKAPGNDQYVYFCQTSYREVMDTDPTNPSRVWGLEAIPGYANPSFEEPAMNTKRSTWPARWSRALPLVTPEWDGYWYGYFGRGVANSQFETFFALDDSQDDEWKRPPYNYYPILSDSSRGGLGLRIEVRGFQWSDVLAEDIIFWHYDIINISDFDHDSTFFGFYSDTGVGGWGDNADDNASYDTHLDLAYAFDSDGKSNSPPPTWQTGYMGYAYLESPGNALNGIDDDEDGMIDERRDDGIDNDGDWVPFTDINGNGIWDPQNKEPLNSDVGQDGVGPFDLQYKGPDVGEGNGVPDNGEPNFEATDKDESDQIGLTSLVIKRLTSHGPTEMWPKNDNVMWSYMQPDTFDTSIQEANIQILFASGPFPLKKNLRERFSMALVWGGDLEDLVFNKETVQEIYNANYNFTRPPNKPTLRAIAGDKKVFLYWDAIAEESTDPFLGYENGDPSQGPKKDFEGYLIYRSEEAEFQDIKVITDSKGDPKYWKPIAQFDVVNGIKGPDPVGINGAHFWRGSDSGLEHSLIDSNVVNGKKYYYACVAYDQGDPERGTKGLLPSETTKIISESSLGEIEFVDINCAVVTPNAPVAGYIPPEITGSLDQVAQGLGTGFIDVTILNPDSVKNGAVYKVKFKSSGTVPTYSTTSYDIIRDLNGDIDTVVANADSSTFGGGQLGQLFDGISISINNSTVDVDQKKTGWLKGGFSTLNMPAQLDTEFVAQTVAWPADYEIEFLEGYTQKSFNNVPINFIIRNVTRGDTVKPFIYDYAPIGELSLGDKIAILEYINNVRKFTWLIGYYKPVSIPFTVYPKAGDIFKITTTKPFYEGDYFNFKTSSARISNEQAENEMEQIRVVPNPYIATNVWESKTLSTSGRGERRIDFINLPAKCNVRIYTVSGALVKTLYKDSSPIDGSISWNLVSDDGMDVAYGLYIFHVDAPGVGEKIGKFALIK